MSPPAVIAALPARTSELAELLEQWCDINSGSGNAPGLQRMRAALRTTFSASFTGACIEELPADGPDPIPAGACALCVRMRPDAPVQILLSGHYDTVFGPDDAFQRCRWVDNTTLNGPGALDMKGGIVTLLAALQTLEQTPNAARLGWEVLLTPDEETGSRGSSPLLRAAAGRHDFGLVFEPARANGDIIHSRKGTGSLTVTCHGRAAHAASMPNDGRSAILALAEFLLAVSRLPEELPGTLVNVGNIHGGSETINVVPDFAEATVDIRTTRTADREPFLARVQALVEAINARDGLHIEIAGDFNRPPKECLPVEETAFRHWQAIARELGLPPVGWAHAGGGSDGNILSAAGLPTLDGVGPLGNHMHSDREYCRVETIAERAQIAALFLHRLASGEIKDLRGQGAFC